MEEFKKIFAAVVEQYEAGVITEREAYSKIVEQAANFYHKTPEVEGFDF